MTGKQREMTCKGQKGKQGECRGNERETKHKDTTRHDGRCREMTCNERTGHTWKMKRTYRENVRDLKGELKGMEGT